MSETRPDTRTAEAADWHTRLGRRAVTAESLEDFRRWRRDPANAAAYARVAGTWDAAGGLAGDQELGDATAAALARHKAPGLRGAKGTAAILLGGGALAAVAAAAWLAAGGLPPGYATRVGEQRLVVLDDGSRVRLNTDSRITVRFSRGERRIALERGEALFEAAHDAARPFVVDAGLARVRAIGTRFDVRRRADGVGVTLLQGKVQVRRDGHGDWTLAPNERLLVRAEGPAAPAAADPGQATAWTEGRIIFHATPLGEAVAEVNRYGRRKVRLDADALAAAPVSGVFDTGDTDGFVSAVTALFALKAEPQDGGVLLTPAASTRG